MLSHALSVLAFSPSLEIRDQLGFFLPFNLVSLLPVRLVLGLHLLNNYPSLLELGGIFLPFVLEIDVAFSWLEMSIAVVSLNFLVVSKGLNRLWG